MSQMFDGQSLAGVGENLFLSEELSDVIIYVNDRDQNQWRFPAHQLVLAAQSFVFRRMLESDFSEKATGSIIIKDVQPKTVELLLGYIYRGRVDLENWLDGLELLCAAHKYEVKPLVQYCIRFLENVVDISNVCYIYNEACLYSLPNLKEKCLKLIVDAAFVVLPSKGFEILSKDAVMDIISRSDLNVDSERMIFEALWKWVPNQCCRLGLQINEETVLKELMPFLKYICFDVMSDADKSSLPSAVLSCVKPSCHNRVSSCVPHSLLQYAHSFNFSVEQDIRECSGDLCCISFSLDSPQCLIGLIFMVTSVEFSSPLHLSFIKESSGSSPLLHTVNLSSASWTAGVKVNEQVFFKAQILFRQPCHLDRKTVYKFHLLDRSRNAYCPRTSLLQPILLSEKGNINISLHSEKVWGVKGLILM